MGNLNFCSKFPQCGRGIGSRGYFILAVFWGYFEVANFSLGGFCGSKISLGGILWQQNFSRGDSVVAKISLGGFCGSRYCFRFLGFARDSNPRGDILLLDVQKGMGRIIAIPTVKCTKFDFLLRH